MKDCPKEVIFILIFVMSTGKKAGTNIIVKDKRSEKTVYVTFFVAGER